MDEWMGCCVCAGSNGGDIILLDNDQMAQPTPSRPKNMIFIKSEGDNVLLWSNVVTFKLNRHAPLCYIENNNSSPSQ